MRNYDPLNPVHMVRFIARERFTWPGGYEICGIANDGALLCSQCVRDNYRDILYSTKHEINDGRRIIWITNESKMEEETCANCLKSLGY